jgi:NitT/TauT family transport system ATP-binding protein
MNISCKGISKVYEAKNQVVLALKDVTFQTKEQEFLCILGPSGCGKTTLLKIIAGILKQSDGHVEFNDIPPQNSPATALVFQEHGVFPWMNVINNICFGLEMRGMPKKERYHKAIPFIEKTGLSGFIKSYPYQLSSGMKQRVGLARALVSGAEVLLMDEPFAALDAQMKLLLQEQLLEIQREYSKSVIYVTHDIDEAILLGDRILLMKSRPGQIKTEISIPFPRPRRLDIENTIEFAKIKAEVWNQLKEEVEKSLEETQV